MASGDRRNGGRPRAAALLGALITFGAGTFGSAASSGAQASGVSGSAFGHYTNVGLFGGPQGANGPAPMVTLPGNGADPALVATEPSAQAVYGPAKIFGGRWPPNLAAAPPSGPISVSVKGKPGPDGSVTSTADIMLFPAPLPVQCDGEPGGSTNCTAPGGFGPNPPTEGDSLHSECTASASGTTGTTRLVNAILATATDPEGDPINEEPVPENPPVNYTRTGQLTNVGDNFKIVYNEQIREPNGALTVNAVHMSLLGPIAVGEQILGQVRCSANGPLSPGLSAPPSTAAAPPTSAATPSTSGATSPVGSTKPESSTSSMPLVVGAAVALAALAGFAFWGRRRGAAKGAGPPDAPT